MAIPFYLPTDEQTEDDYRRLDQLLNDFCQVLRRILRRPASDAQQDIDAGGLAALPETPTRPRRDLPDPVAPASALAALPETPTRPRRDLPDPVAPASVLAALPETPTRPRRDPPDPVVLASALADLPETTTRPRRDLPDPVALASALADLPETPTRPRRDPPDPVVLARALAPSCPCPCHGHRRRRRACCAPHPQAPAFDQWLVIGEQLRMILDEFKTSKKPESPTERPATGAEGADAAQPQVVQLQVRTHLAAASLLMQNLPLPIWTTVILLVGWGLLVARSR